MLTRAVLAVKGKELLHHSNHYVHLTYLVLVSVESHGLYGIAAGVLGVIVAIDGVWEHIDKRKVRQDERTKTTDL
jgi:hypothetical protein